MEYKSVYFSSNLNNYCKDIPKEHLKEIVTELSANAIFIMNTDIDAAATGRSIDTILDMLKNGRFSYMPLYLVCEGYHNGALGELGGTTKFTVRNVNTWLSVMNEKLVQINIDRKTKEDQERRKKEAESYKGVQKRSNLYGAALFRKIEWCYAGLVSSSDYDRLTLDKIVEAMEKGYSIRELQPSMII